MHDYAQVDWLKLLKTLKSYALSRSASAADADDIAQEALVRAFTAVESGTVVGDLYSFAARIAMNLATDLHRRKSRKSAPISVDTLLNAVDHGAQMPEQMIDSENPEEALLRREQEAYEDWKATVKEKLKSKYLKRCGDMARSANYRFFWRRQYQEEFAQELEAYHAHH